jgi:hypothetical protein
VNQISFILQRRICVLNETPSVVILSLRKIKPATAVIVTDQQVVRNPISDSTYFAAE